MKWIGTQVTYDDLRLKRRLYLDSPVAGGSDPDKFLGVNSDGKVIYRTGAQLLSDIGGGAVNSISLLPDNTSDYAVSTIGGGSAILRIVGGDGIDTTANNQIGLGGSTGYPEITITGEAASDTNAGIVELATTAETTTGTSTTLAVTPDGLKDGYQGSANVTTLGTITTGTWQGTAIASAYLDADTAHYSATRQLTHHGISDDIDSDVVYISLLESDAENTSAANKHLPIIAPADGKLLKIFVRTTVDQSSETFTWKLYTRTTSQSTNGAAAEIASVAGAGPTNKTMVTYDFTTGLGDGETNAIGAGDKVQISLQAGDGATANGGYFITCLWEWNLA